ncbi:MAG: hypothetical protein ACRENZ_11350 [Thermodesulfobacteriota bacterium]
MKKIIIAVCLWFFISLLVGASGLLASIPPPFPQIILFSLVLVLLIIFWKSESFREVCFDLDIRVLLLIHLTRFVGIYFLILYSRGELPYAFAVHGGLGDIAVAFTALLVSIFPPRAGGLGFFIYFAWNILGLIDILYVVKTAARSAIADPQSMMALTELPLSLLPTFLVPIIIFSHILIFFRLNYSYRNRDPLMTF